MPDERFEHDRYLVDQLIRPIANLYRITPLAAGETPLGGLHHLFRQSLFRSTWRMSDANDGEIATTQERSLPMAIARRLVDFVPYGEWLPIPYNFDLLIDGRVVGSLNRKFQLRDRYVLDLAGDHERKVDRRLAIALAIGLDALQNR